MDFKPIVEFFMSTFGKRVLLIVLSLLFFITPSVLEAILEKEIFIMLKLFIWFIGLRLIHEAMG